MSSFPTYLQAQFYVDRDKVKDFKTEMKNILPLMFDYFHWELVHASYPVSGELNRFTQIWQIPDEASVLQVMLAGAVEDDHVPPSPPPPGVSAEEITSFRQQYQKIQNLLRETTHSLTTSLPHDPAHVGHQSQTIIVDTEGEPFLLEHHAMRQHWAPFDIKEDLEAFRRARSRRGTPEARPESPDAKADARRQEQNRRLQDLLNDGATVAQLQYDQEKTLLFNLAGIKPKSVLQEYRERSETEKRPQFKSVSNGNGVLDANQLLIATPWGGVYKVNQEALDVGGVVKQIDPAELSSTAKRLLPLMESKVPMASVPEERSTEIGDGCMCYVINLGTSKSAIAKMRELCSKEEGK